MDSGVVRAAPPFGLDTGARPGFPWGPAPAVAPTRDVRTAGGPSLQQGTAMPSDYVRAGETRTVLQTDDVRVTERSLTEGQSIPWHFHTVITDNFFCLAGTLRIALREPAEEVLLGPGDSFRVPPHRAHEVTPGAPEGCRFLNVQGVGRYDRNPVAP